MEIKTLKKLVKLIFFAKKIKKTAIFYLETAAYLLSWLFVAMLVLVILYYGYAFLMEYEILRYYATGIMIIVALCVSIAFIKKYNNKYRKNDSNSSKRQDNFLFEENIRK